MLTLEPAGRYRASSYYDLAISKEMRAKDGGALKEGAAITFGTVPMPRVNKVSPAPNSQGWEYDPRLQIDFAFDLFPVPWSLNPGPFLQTTSRRPARPTFRSAGR